MRESPDGMRAVAKRPEVAPLICGAKLRDGTLCLTPPAKERKRCVKHGGAPRSGAPKGNSNALKHGAYADDKVGLQLPRLERAVEEAMTRIAQQKDLLPFDALPPTAIEKATGHQIFTDTQQMLLKVMAMTRERRMAVSTRTALIARRDALSFLLKEPCWFESAAAFRWGVSLTFKQRLRARAKLRDVSQADRFEYSRAWGRVCRELYLLGWPEDVQQAKSNK